MEYAVYAFIIIFGFLLQRFLSNSANPTKLDQVLDDAEQSARLHGITGDAILMRLEDHDGVIFCYDFEDTFLLQGKTSDDITKAFNNRFPNDYAVVLDDESAELLANLK